MPEFTARQRIVKAALRQGMEEGVVGAMIDVGMDADLSDIESRVTATLKADLNAGREVTILIIPDADPD
jgi:hypothetical protein